MNRRAARSVGRVAGYRRTAMAPCSHARRSLPLPPEPGAPGSARRHLAVGLRRRPGGPGERRWRCGSTSRPPDAGARTDSNAEARASPAARPGGSPAPSALPGRRPVPRPHARRPARPRIAPADAARRRSSGALERARPRGRSSAIPGAVGRDPVPGRHDLDRTSGSPTSAAKTPVTPDTPFAFASISKTFTAALILQLVDEGKLAPERSGGDCCLPSALKVDARITVAQAPRSHERAGRLLPQPEDRSPPLQPTGRTWTPAGRAAVRRQAAFTPGRPGTTRTRTTWSSG